MSVSSVVMDLAFAWLSRGTLMRMSKPPHWRDPQKWERFCERSCSSVLSLTVRPVIPGRSRSLIAMEMMGVMGPPLRKCATGNDAR